MGLTGDDLTVAELEELASITNLEIGTIYNLIEAGWKYVNVEGQPAYWLEPDE